MRRRISRNGLSPSTGRASTDETNTKGIQMTSREDRIRRAASDGFDMLTEGVNFDDAIRRATCRFWITEGSDDYLAVRYRMARMLYEW